MRYQTGTLIGRGGMGEVARTWDPVLRRHVALKFLLSTDPEHETRMLREARAQARVDHPNVCRIYDVGRDDGRSFIAMQCIDGRPLHEVAERLNLEQKVVIVETVAGAVHAAHSAGLIHRDLKPANILVEEPVDGPPRPFVVDFGIAREQSVEGHTYTGQVLGTPGYLSPEQARGEVTTLDRRSDVFSLGVILYQLLSGRLPHHGDSDAETLVHLLEEEPIALRRLAPNVHRDLETIVMTCLEADRERRYSTARALAEDLARFRVGDAIHARPAGRLNRLARRARKYPWFAATLGAAGLTVLLLSSLLIFNWIQHTVDLSRQRNRALAAEREAEEIADFLIGIFRLNDPGTSRGASVTASEILEQGVRDLDHRLGNQPMTQARLLEVVAGVYGSLGLYDRSIAMAQRALALRSSHEGEGGALMADSLGVLGDAYVRQRDFAAAEGNYARALSLMGDSSDPSDVVRAARLHTGLAQSLVSQGRNSEAQGHIDSALEVLAGAVHGDDPALLDALGVRGMILRGLGELDQAEALYEDLLERYRRSINPGSSRALATMNNLAFLLTTRGDHEAAAELYREALDFHVAILGTEHPNTQMVRRNLAGSFYHAGDFAAAEVVLREAVDVARSVPDLEPWRLASLLGNSLAQVQLIQGRSAEAEPLLREAVALLEADLGPSHSWAVLGRCALAGCLLRLGPSPEGERLAAEGLAHLAALPELTPDNRRAIEHVVTSFSAAGRSDLGDAFSEVMAADLRRKATPETAVDPPPA